MWLLDSQWTVVLGLVECERDGVVVGVGAKGNSQ
jgi:hypothetical protein